MSEIKDCYGNLEDFEKDMRNCNYGNPYRSSFMSSIHKLSLYECEHSEIVDFLEYSLKLGMFRCSEHVDMARHLCVYHKFHDMFDGAQLRMWERRKSETNK